VWVSSRLRLTWQTFKNQYGVVAPTLGRFDSCAAPLSRFCVVRAGAISASGSTFYRKFLPIRLPSLELRRLVRELDAGEVDRSLVRIRRAHRVNALKRERLGARRRRPPRTFAPSLRRSHVGRVRAPPRPRRREGGAGDEQDRAGTYCRCLRRGQRGAVSGSRRDIAGAARTRAGIVDDRLPAARRDDIASAARTRRAGIVDDRLPAARRDDIASASR
jgi:hypothetical protein